MQNKVSKVSIECYIDVGKYLNLLGKEESKKGKLEILQSRFFFLKIAASFIIVVRCISY